MITKLELDDKVSFAYHDVDTVEGMMERAYHDISQIPTTIIEKNEQVIERWNGEVPHSEKLKEHLAA